MSTGPTPVPATDRLYEDAACGLLLADTDGTIRRANRTFCEQLGYAPAELVGRRRVQDLLSAGGRLFHQTHWGPLLQLQGSVAEVKLQFVHRDAYTVPMMLNAVRREYGGAAFHEMALSGAAERERHDEEWLAASRQAGALLVEQQSDQQELILAQARLRLALDSGLIYVWDVDPATGLRRYEDAVAMLLGQPVARPVSDAEFEAAVDPADRERGRLAFALAMAPGAPAYNCVFRVSCAGGVQRTVQSSGQGLFDLQGGLLQFVGVMQDITGPNRLRAIAEDRALFAEQMVGIVSHDLRNPLSAIQMGALLLGRGDPSPGLRRTLARITSSADRAQRLIEDLLDFTQARVGRGLSVTRRPVDLRSLVADSVEDLALSFPGRGLLHEHRGADTCLADADRLVQALGNLVANAMAYGTAARPVTVASAVTPEGFTLSVHNEGEPVAPELMPGLFRAMTRGAGAHTTGRSVGLGLFIVREIARAHGGDAAVVSGAAAGTTFTITGPR